MPYIDQEIVSMCTWYIKLLYTEAKGKAGWIVIYLYISGDG